MPKVKGQVLHLRDNVVATVEGSTLHLAVDCSRELYHTAKGSAMHGTLGGGAEVQVDGKNVTIGLNVYTKEVKGAEV
jgi:hypothetical protein